MKLSWLFVIGLLVLVAVFSVQNAQPITVRFIIWEFVLSAALAIGLAAILGGVIGLIVGTRSQRPPRPNPPPPPPEPTPSFPPSNKDNTPGTL